MTPEYNHSMPGAPRNAINSVWASSAFRNKPVAAVGCSAGIGGGIWAVQHLSQIAIEAEAVPLRNTVVIPFTADAFDALDQPKDPVTAASPGAMLDDLAW